MMAYLVTSTILIELGHAMRKTQQDARQRGELLRTTLESIGDAVITTDVAGRVTSMNPVAETLVGCTEREGQGQ